VRLAAWAVFAGLVAVLGGCGLHFRQAPVLPASMQRLYIAAGSGDAALVRELRRSLTSDSTHIVSDPKDSSATLGILKTQQLSRVLTVNNLGQPTEYEVAYQVDFTLQADGAMLIPRQTLTLTRNYAYSVSNAVGNQEQANVLYGALSRDMAQLIVFRIEAAARTAPAAATLKTPAVATGPSPLAR
jgi:LPS-assembly lipoprotein